MKRMALIAAACMFMATPALADLTDYAVFGANGVALDKDVRVSGLVGSGGDVGVGHNSSLGGVRAGGDLTIAHDVQVAQDVVANGDVSVAHDSAIGGNVIAGGSLTLGSGVTYASTASGAGTPYSPIPTLPAPTDFSSFTGGSNQTVAANHTLSLAPSTYGSLTGGRDSTVNLSAGTYFFDAISVGHNSTMNLNLGGGDIVIYVGGNTVFDHDVIWNVSGGSAKDIYIETHGDFALGYMNEDNTDVDFFGTVFASGGTVALGESNITAGHDLDLAGAFYSDDKISLGYETNLDFELSDHFAQMVNPVPVPGAAILGILGLGIAGAKLRKRVSTS